MEGAHCSSPGACFISLGCESLAHLQRPAAAHGLVIESWTRCAIRKEGDEAVDGLLVVMRRP